MNKLHTKGYSLIEVLLVVGMFAVLAIIAFPSAMQESGNSKLRSAVKQMESSAFVAQQNAYAGLGDASYGVAFYVNKYTIFIGSSVLTASSKEDILLPSNMTIGQIILTGGGNEVLFTKGNIKPNKSGTIALKDSVSTYMLNISSEGLIQSYKQ
jgi:prepilin-type N-terminal cleavage/methylation domain-containing protein